MQQLQIVLLNTPPEYGEDKWVKNIKHMLKNVNQEYEKIHVVTDVVYGGVWDKLRVFDLFRDGQFLFLDLDVAITGKIGRLKRESFTLLTAWWRPKFHTPLNSSIMAWKGDCSWIHDKFAEDPEYYMLKYHRGIDEFIWNEITHYETFGLVCDSYNWKYDNSDKFPITLYNQARDKLWEHECTLSESETDTIKV